MKKLTVLMIGLLFAACSKETAEPVASLGSSIETPYAKVVVLQEGVELKVTKIEDSRCPMNVVCVWEGMVKVYFNLSAGGTSKEAAVEVYGDSTKPRTALVELNGNNYLIEVKEVSPYPETPNPIRLEDYKVRFVITKI